MTITPEYIAQFNEHFQIWGQAYNDAKASYNESHQDDYKDGMQRNIYQLYGMLDSLSLFDNVINSYINYDDKGFYESLSIIIENNGLLYTVTSHVKPKSTAAKLSENKA